MERMRSFVKNNAFTIVIALILLAYLSFRMVGSLSSKSVMEVKAEKWDKLMVVLEQIDKNYVDSLNHKDLTERILPILMRELDPHSIYLSPDMLQVAEDELAGNFEGIGVQFNIPQDTVVVINVMQDGPSEKAGLLQGDRIVKVGDKLIAGIKMDQDSIIKMLRGKSGTTVTLGIKREHTPQLLTIPVKRDRILDKSVEVAYMLNDTLGYVKLKKFTRNSYKEFISALSLLKKSNLKSLIFDLRGNTGGFLDQALLLSNEFLNQGDLIVYMEGLHRKRQDFKADNKGLCHNIGLKVLIDEGSASSSEIFAGAIQDNDRGIIIGRRSFGKGLVQEPIYFSDSSGIRLTVARFYTPTGRSIQKPFSPNYENDINDRFLHGEMSFVDSIRQNKSMRYETKGGKVVYGGGGITPDIFIPIDTTDITKFLIKSNNSGLAFRFASQFADRYRSDLNRVKSVEELMQLLNTVGYDSRFLEYAEQNSLKPTQSDWAKSGYIILTQVRALIGRYTPIEDKAFYSIMSEIDPVMKVAIGQ